MSGADQRETDTDRQGGRQDGNCQPGPAAEFDVNEGGPEKDEDSWEVHNRADRRNSIDRNTGSGEQVGQGREFDADNDSEGKNKQAENPRREPSAPIVHGRGSLAGIEVQKAGKGQKRKGRLITRGTGLG